MEKVEWEDVALWILIMLVIIAASVLGHRAVSGGL
jgi:hypothetical protein